MSDDFGFERLHNNAGKAIPALNPENGIHAAFLERDDIKAMSEEAQAVEWELHKQSLAAFFSALEGVPLFGVKK